LVKEEKIEKVKKLKELIDSYRIVGLLDMFKLPAKHLQEISKKIRGRGLIKMTKKSILRFAIKKSEKRNIGEMEKFIPQQPALILSDMEPFRFYLMISKLKLSGFAKEGDIAPENIIIPAGPTSLLPGPVISELNKAGIPVGIEEGRISVKKDAMVAKKDDKISKELAIALRKLNVKPMKIGLNIVAIYDNGKIYGKEVLSLVGENYLNKLKEALNQALNLSVGICYPTKENIKLLLAKAFNNAKALESRLGGVN
jgi:large subunit ribosomal protein L10